MKYVRFRHQERESYGLLEGESVLPFEGDLFGERRPTGVRLPLAEVTLLVPVRRWSLAA